SGDLAGPGLQRRINAGAATPRAAARDVAILTALGAPADSVVQNFLLGYAPQGGSAADAGVLLALKGAVERGAQGEAALLAVAAAGDGPARLDAASVSQIVRALRAARLEDDARRFAAEAILAGSPAAPAARPAPTQAPRQTGPARPASPRAP